MKAERITVGDCVYLFDGPRDVLALDPVESWNNRSDRAPVFKAALDAVTLPGPWAQFGVYQGHTAKRFIIPRLGDHQLYLFDSFDGLPEDWDKGASVEPRGKYACEPPAFNHSRVTVVKGLFDGTVNDFKGTEAFGFVDIDCDLYSSTSEVLTGINDLIVPGTVIRFDDLFCFPNWRNGEWRALKEWLRHYQREIRWLARGQIYWACCEVVK